MPGSSGARRAGRYRYGSWSGGADPLAPPYDVREVVDEIGAEVMAGSSLREAMERMMRRGLGDRGGLDELRRRLAKRRREIERRGNLGDTMREIRQELDRGVRAEQEFLAGKEGDDARFKEMELDTLPDDTAGMMSQLADYQWASAEGQQAYQNALQMLQREVLDSQFQGMKQALSGQDPAAMQAVKDMMADLNQLLGTHARGEDTSEQFADFMDKHGEFFPDDPQNVDELLDSLARRAAAAERMMQSLSPQQRDELAQLMAQAMQDAGLEAEMGALSDNLRSLRPGMFSGPGQRGRPGQFGGQGSMGLSDAVSAVADLADVESLEQQLSQAYGGGSLDDVDVEALERQLPQQSVRDLRALRDLQRELERQGYLRQGDDGITLTPKALRRLGETALKRIFAHLEGDAQGAHQDPRSGAAEERTGAFLPWDLRRRAADRRRPHRAERGAAAGVDRGSGSMDAGASPLRLEVGDFEVAETTRRTGAAVALCVDLSFSMIQEDRWGPMKQTALALAHLVSTRFRQDALQIIGFDRLARPLTAMQLAEVEPEWIQGTNLHHALMLAGRHLRRHPDMEPVVLVVTDGEPTAHLLSDGTPVFQWPTTPETVRATVGEVDAMTRYGAPLNFFLLGDDPGLARFVDSVARRNGGRVFTPELGDLGSYVVADYLAARGGRRRSA